MNDELFTDVKDENSDVDDEDSPGLVHVQFDAQAEPPLENQDECQG